jgi:prepilin-type N-terminal cleavage/methylation domain-containing protein
MARRKGFTVVELLVAVALSAIVLVTVYLVFNANTRQYYTQEQVVQMQEAMRFALEYLKTDLRNAGRDAIVDGVPGPEKDPGFCAAGAQRRGVELFENDPGQPGVLTANGNGLVPDRLRIYTDASGGARLATSRVAGGIVSVLPGNMQRTDEARDELSNQTRFNRIYRAGYFLRVEATDTQDFDLVPIQDAQYNGGQPQIRLANLPCFDTTKCDAGKCLINPVQLVEYAIVTDPPNSANAPKTDLVRRVMNASNTDQELADQTVTIAEYVVNFQVWGMYDTRAVGAPMANVPADPNPADTVGNWPGAQPESVTMRANPQRIRSLNLLLAVRTPREDPEYTVAVDLATQPANRVAADRTWFDVPNVGAPALARVATLSTEVETPNMTKVF